MKDKWYYFLYDSIIIIVICICFLGLFGSCFEPKITSGEVYDKEYIESYTYSRPVTNTIYDGKNNITFTTYIQDTYPAQYIIYIRQYDYENDTYITEDFNVTETMYNSVNIGQYVEFNNNMMTIIK